MSPHLLQTREQIPRRILPVAGAVKLSIGATSHPYLLETVGLFTQGWRPDRTFRLSVGGSFRNGRF